MDTRNRTKVESSRKTNPCFKIAAVITLIVSIYIAQSPVFKLSKPLKTNFIK